MPIRNQKVEPSEDNMLKVTNYGRKLALDQRLNLHPDMPDMENSKGEYLRKHCFFYLGAHQKASIPHK